MPRKRTIKAADLFCGAGGTSTGLLQAARKLDVKLDLVAVNHWERAVETHAANHPTAGHFCEDLTTLDPRKAVPGGKLDILVASPECTHHSVARGGVPMNDQSRASAWCVLRWATALRIDQILIENVPEFISWGPIGTNGRPLKSRKGETFSAFVSALESLGYRVEWRVMNSADYAAATSRRRIFLRAVRGRRPINWPEPTHAEHPTPGLFGHRHKWRAAREIINWQHKGKSIYNRPRPLVMNTLKRIEAGLRKFGGANAEPFLVVLRNHMDGRSVDDPLPTLAAGGNHVGLCEPKPFILPHQQFDHLGADSVDDPIRTITATNGRCHRLVEPFITTMNFTASRDHDDGYSIDPDAPLPTITSQGNRFGLVEPFIVPTNYGEREGQSPRCHNIERTLPTVVTGNTHAIVEPFAMHTTHHGADRVHDLSSPLPTITTANRGEMALIDPFLVSFYGNDRDADSVADPLRTVTTKDRHGLVQPHGVKFDILFRMLEPEELKRGMGFPGDYRITGNREEQVRQIGNAVEVNQAEAHGASMLEGAAA